MWNFALESLSYGLYFGDGRRNIHICQSVFAEALSLTTENQQT